jgi:hypothetical protein
MLYHFYIFSYQRPSTLKQNALLLRIINQLLSSCYLQVLPAKMSTQPDTRRNSMSITCLAKRTSKRSSMYNLHYLEIYNVTTFSLTPEQPTLFFSSYHLCQVLESCPPLVNDLVEGFGRPDRSYDDLVTSRCETVVCLICEPIQGHTELSTVIFAQIVV